MPASCGESVIKIESGPASCALVIQQIHLLGTRHVLRQSLAGEESEADLPLVKLTQEETEKKCTASDSATAVRASALSRILFRERLSQDVECHSLRCDRGHEKSAPRREPSPRRRHPDLRPPASRIGLVFLKNTLRPSPRNLQTPVVHSPVAGGWPVFAGPFVDETRSAPLCCLCSSVKAQVTEEGVPSQGSLFCTDLPACPEPCSCAWSLLSLSSWPAIPRWLPWVWVSVESHRQSHLSGSPGPALSVQVGAHVTFSRVSSLKDASLFGSAPSRS
ncbi:uncharacterized protein LOC106505210 [Sus scrofa]|uniref:uncharacterized protein LOC106505210 n=1 Tax=Sus scrofa TaxID=9823 RepID=UPI000A2B6A4B|nr:uncharacterized protein LOC106505210 [Sus scrofa]